MARSIRVLLIGGTSHVGKSTLASRVAATLGWNQLSTDQFARHPGRPWRDDRSRLPADVIAHYSSESAVGLLDSVLRHYRHNVWPIAAAVVRSHENNPFDPCLVLEGSAILPDLVRSSHFERSDGVWLTAANDLIRERILENSGFDDRSRSERELIDAFAQRAVAFNAIVVESARRLGRRCLDAGSTDVLPDLLRLARAS